MEPVAEGSNHFLRGFDNPLLSLCTLSFLFQNAWAKPWFYVVRKNIILFLNGLIAKLENTPTISSSQKVCLLTHQKFLFFLCRCR